ncbi:PAS domain-containing protein [Reichenbachiella carrageenanivorans]|uniref:Oxygen sensor histidine kinase NreB n=1 Tax=Reichenbachiella carrageenanivorans TaxID=2979869 RepID=A0ABY6CXC3_9BACT|nr:PAS domain-containing protein [Reichenbachiella carrageenanivorans]UXX78518.1 PAS domain-containing protein [Reichenbachiella carrageenanivorans]
MTKTSDEVLEGVLLAINELIANHNFAEALDNSVRMLGELFDSDCLLSKITRENDHWLSSVEHYWMKIPNKIRIEQNQNLLISSFGDINHTLGQGQIFCVTYSEAKGKLRSHLEKTGGKSVVLVPIMRNDTLWGTLALADLDYERQWSNSIQCTLRSLATAISATLLNKQQKTNLKSEIKKRNEALLNQNARYLSLIENVPGIIFRCKNDQHWSMEFISAYVYTVTGYQPTDFLDHAHGIHFNDIIYASDKQFAKEEVESQLLKGIHYRVTYRIQTKDGVIRWLWEQGVQVLDRGDEYLEGCIVDISDRVNGHEKILAATLEAEDRERSRISRNIHDNLQQLLITAHMNIAYLKKRQVDFTEKEKRKYEIANDYLQKAIAESRSLSHKLMPKAIEDYGFEAAVEGLIENIDDVVDTKFEFYNNLKGEHLDAKMELCLFRITQEAISNVIKFAQAKRCTIQLLRHKTSIMLMVEDDGVGFDKSQLILNGDSFGINSMKNRSSSIGGQFFIDTQVGKGTQLIVEIPN